MPLALEILLIALVAAAGIYDFRTRKIPNWLNLSGFILGLGLNTFFLHGAGIASSGLGLAFALAIYLPLYLLRGMGAGDVKLMAAVGAIAGPSNWLGIFLATALLGGILSVVLIGLKRRFVKTCFNVGLILQELSHGRPPAVNNPHLDIRDGSSLRMPHGTVIAAGSIAFLVFRAAS
jgi:prepilin peptidase CpaA